LEEEKFFLVRKKHVVKRMRTKTIIKAFNIIEIVFVIENKTPPLRLW